MAKKVIKKIKKADESEDEFEEVEIEASIEPPSEVPKKNSDFAELNAIHAGLTKFGIRDIGQLEVILARMI